MTTKPWPGCCAPGPPASYSKGVPPKSSTGRCEAVAGGGAWLDPAVTARVLAVYRAAPAGPTASSAALDQLTGGNGTSLPSSAKDTPTARSPGSSSSAKAP